MILAEEASIFSGFIDVTPIEISKEYKIGDVRLCNTIYALINLKKTFNDLP